jgi:hypothetical protein
MRTIYLIPCLLTAVCLSSTAKINAQKSNAFAITGSSKGDISWMTVKQIDLSTGSVVRDIYSPKDKPATIDALSGARTASVTAPTETFVAATAYDTKTNRLFFTPMHSNELRYFDLSKGTSAVYYVRNTPLKSFEEKSEADVITRMCFGADGYGYALTNDANHLIRFTSGSKITVSDLGSVKDGADNENISIRNLCTSWGGDMIADAMGNLYVISMKRNVFKIDPQTMVADFMGQIENMPADYTINGAAVDDKGKVIVSSATRTDNYYSIDLATLKANVVAKKGTDVYNASDLASGHLAYENTADAKVNPAVNVTGNAAVSVFPNPVPNRSFQVSFDKVAAGSHTLQVTTVSGTSVLSKVIDVNTKSVAQINLPSSVRSGVYMIKVIDNAGKVTYSGKIVVY